MAKLHTLKLCNCFASARGMCMNRFVYVYIYIYIHINEYTCECAYMKRAYYSMLQCVAVCCVVLKYAALCRTLALKMSHAPSAQSVAVLQCSASYCSVLQCASTCCSVLQCVTVCCSVLHLSVEDVSSSQRTVCCSVLQC